MKIVADESVDKPLVDAFRSAAYHIEYILEDHQGAKDKEVLKITNKKQSILPTVDRDFGELVFRQKLLSFGIILLRLRGLTIQEKISLILSSFKLYHSNFNNGFTVITNSHIRFVKISE